MTILEKIVKGLAGFVLICVAIPPTCVAIAGAGAFLGFMGSTPNGWETRNEKYIEIAEYLELDGLEGLENVVFERRGYTLKDTAYFRIIVQKLVCEKVYTDANLPVGQYLEDMENFYTYPDRCVESPYWPPEYQ